MPFTLDSRDTGGARPTSSLALEGNWQVLKFATWAGGGGAVMKSV